MKPTFLITIIIMAAVLLAYMWIEKRINQRGCRKCGFRISVDAIEDQCPRCGAAM